MDPIGRKAKFLTLSKIFLVVALTFLSFPALVSATTTPTVDVKANGSDGPVSITSGDSYSYSWTSSDASACELSSPLPSGVSLSGGETITSGTAFYYPAEGSSVTISISCTDGVASVSDSVTVSVVAPVVPAPTADIKANGSDGPVSITSGDSYTYSWTSSNATACEVTSPAPSGVSLSGSSTVSSGSVLYYPSAGGSVTITLSCTNGADTVTDSVTISIPADSGGSTTTPAVTVDVRANGSDGPVSITSGDSYTYSWTSSNATACEVTSPAISGVSLTGTETIASDNVLYYPTSGSPVTITLSCTDGTSTATDSVVVSIASSGGGGGGGSCTAPSITSSATASGQVGSTFSHTFSALSGDPSSLSWTVDNSALPLGLSYATSTLTISGTPTVSGTFNIATSITDSCGTASDTLVITVDPASSGGGGGGGTGGGGGGGSGGGGGGSSSPSSGTSALPAVDYCPYLTDYMRADFVNDPAQVIFLQVFLSVREGHNYVEVNGVFDEATFIAVQAFQEKYRADVLEPWAEGQAPTGYVYITTLHKINEIMGCQSEYTLPEQQEIESFVPDPDFPAEIGEISGPPVIGLVPEPPSQGQNPNLAATLFAWPQGWGDFFQCTYEYLLVLIVLYLLSTGVSNVLYRKTEEENVHKKFIMKWTMINTGLALALLLAYIFERLCLTLPLFITLGVALTFTLTQKKHRSYRASIKSWYLIFSGRIRTVWNNTKRRIKDELLLVDNSGKSDLPQAVDNSGKPQEAPKAEDPTPPKIAKK